MNPIVIIGTGMAGYGLLREFRKRDPDTPVTLITADDGRVYSKPNLSNAFAQNRAPAQLASDTAARAAGKFRASVLTHTRVEAIDTAGKRLATDAGEIVYGRLVLALGADPIASGLDGPLVQAINDLDDYTRFRAALDGKRRVTILGGGLIGCEFANDLVGNALVAETGAKAIEVDVVHRGAWPLERLIPEAVGQALAEALEQRGARWHFGRTASRIEADAGGARVLLDDGEELETDLVLSAIGLRPRVELASAAGIAVGRGIVVDRELRTSAPEVWAIGDCAEVEGHVLPFVQPLLIQARRPTGRRGSPGYLPGHAGGGEDRRLSAGGAAAAGRNGRSMAGGDRRWRPARAVRGRRRQSGRLRVERQGNRAPGRAGGAGTAITGVTPHSPLSTPHSLLPTPYFL